MELPEGFQHVFVHFSGSGLTQYFTAPSKEAASEFISSQTDHLTEYSSAWITGLFCLGKDYSGFFRHGQIPLSCVELNRIEIKGLAVNSLEQDFL